MVALLSLTKRQRKNWDSFREMLEWTDLVIPEVPLVSRKLMFAHSGKYDAYDFPDVWQLTKGLRDICAYEYPAEREEDFQELLEQELEEKSGKSEQSGQLEQSDNEEEVLGDGVNSLSS